MEFWELSTAVLWVLILLILVYLVALTRQVGVLHLRIQPVGARITDMGPEIGEQLPELRASDVFGKPTDVIESGRPRLLLFVSPACIACQEILPAIKAVVKAERGALDVVLVTAVDDVAANSSFIEREGLAHLPYISSPSLAREYGVTATPYALLIDEDRIVRSKGIVNQIEHLESLFNMLRDQPNANGQSRLTGARRDSEHERPQKV